MYSTLSSDVLYCSLYHCDVMHNEIIIQVLIQVERSDSNAYT